MTCLDPAHHVFRHIKQTWMDGEFIEPAAFRLAKKGTEFEEGLSVNWVEYFQVETPEDAIPPLREVLEKKGRRIGGASKFALLNVKEIKEAAALYIAVTISLDEEDNDKSHTLIKGYETYNDEVAEEIAKIVIASFPAKA